MKDIFNFIYKPNSENRERIFSKNIDEKRNLSIKVFLFGFIFFEIFANLIYIKFWFEFISIIISIILLWFYYFLANIIFSVLLYWVSKIFGNKKFFIDTFLVILIPLMFASIIYGTIFWIIFLAFLLGIFDLFFLVYILGIIVIFWTLWLFLVLLNWNLEHKWKTLWTVLTLITPIFLINIYIQNTYEWLSEKARDSVRITNLSSIENSLNIYFAEKNYFPESLEEIKSYLYKEIKDPKEWEKSKNGCEFTYKYEKISEKTYKISICPESKVNIEKAKNDGWTDEKRLEFIKEV